MRRSREVVSRRYRDAGHGQELYPDVIVIDGGLGQLHAAIEAFDQLEVKPPMVISLAKKEELIYRQARSQPIRLGRQNPGLKLCQAIRDRGPPFRPALSSHLTTQKSHRKVTPPRTPGTPGFRGSGGSGNLLSWNLRNRLLELLLETPEVSLRKIPGIPLETSLVCYGRGTSRSKP